MEYDTIFVAARRAGNELALVDAGRLSRTVAKAAALLRENAGKVLAANALDLESMDADSPMRDRLRLTAERIASIAADMESVAGLPSPQGETIAEWTRPNGMTLRKVRVDDIRQKVFICHGGFPPYQGIAARMLHFF